METKDRLLKAAKEEFMEKGFAKSSLRSICKKANVTTGALYFFFQDKEDLFSALVKGIVDKLHEIMTSHFSSEMNDDNKVTSNNIDMEEDLNESIKIVRFMVMFREELILLLTKAKGSKYENILDTFITITENHYRALADKRVEYNGCAKIDDSIIHWLSHMQIDSFVYIITHNLTEEEAIKHIQTVVQFSICGWLGLYKMGNKDI